MESNTSMIEFHILPFFMKADNDLFVFSTVFFFLIYFIGISVNLIIILVICLDPHLHTPMYLFLCNLSIIDICYITFIVPKLLSILLSGHNTVSFTQCIIQAYFVFLASTSEDAVLFIMAYDRYVAICHPLDYHRILNNKICLLLIMLAWISGGLNSSFMITSIPKILFCSSSTVHQIFCDPKALISIACSGTERFYGVVYTDMIIFALCPVLCNVISYVKIIRVILCMKCKDGRRKAFSTCSSHLIVMAVYYVSGAAVYMTPSSDRYDPLEETLTVFYTTVVPTLNPLICSIRNQKIQSSMKNLLAKH